MQTWHFLNLSGSNFLLIVWYEGLEGVADASTAHIAKLISKQKPSKKSKSGSAKPAVVTRTWGSSGKTNSHQKIKTPLKDFNSFPPSTLDRKEKNSKLMHLTPAQQELKKSVLINLRSVVQSCKDGVPLNRLQKDYRKFIGSYIPFENLGYSTLYEFIRSIPDVLNLKMDANEQFIAIGVVDEATAHLFGNPVKPKPSKPLSPPNEPSVNNRATLQISSEQKAESAFFKLPQNTMDLSDLNSVLKHAPAKKKVRKKTQPIYSVSEMLAKNKMKHASKEELVKAEPPKAAKPVISCKENSAPEDSLSKTDITSLQNQNKFAKTSNQNLSSTSAFQTANTISARGKCNKKHSSISASENSVEKERTLNSCCSSTSESNIQLVSNVLIQPERRINCIVSSKSSDQDGSSKSTYSSVGSTEDVKTSGKKNPVTLYSKKAEQRVRRKAKKIQDQIKIASLSPLVWMHFILHGPSEIETLRKKVLSFYGFPFSTDSKEWKEKISLLSQLPKEILHQCLYLLRIEYDLKDSKKSLQDKLFDFLATYTEKSETNAQETGQKDNEKELYASTLTLSSVSSDVLSKCSYYADTETSDAVLSDKKCVATKTKHKIVSDSDSDFMELPLDGQNLLRKSSHRPEEAKKPVQVEQPNDKRNFHVENSEGIQSGKNCETKHSASTKSALQKPSATEKITSVVQNQQPLGKNSVEQKAEAEECSKTETSSLVSSKSAKRNRRRKRKKSENAQKSIGLSVTKPVKGRMPWWQVQQMIKLKKKKREKKLLLSSAVEAKIAT
ncbi:hypothetical protein AVEN_213491-3 [Araneus ventricosus]|uniref:HTH OST-type domain-containing protein n=1 Tax=Araneus ventricosus TaxID=182803 RepID=A0A4Y2NPX9_ARAVE|nr:hypothetical protein AVEN_213491-3 [Araneus ventricosus]